MFSHQILWMPETERVNTVQVLKTKKLSNKNLAKNILQKNEGEIKTFPDKQS